MLDLCASAQQTLDVEQYIFSRKGIGADLMSVLTERARAGVRVRLLVDGYGSLGLAPSEAGRAFCKAGGELVYYNALLHLVKNPFAGVHRLHRKSILCDGRQMMVGGSCFEDRMADWRDTMVLASGDIVTSAELAFERVWRYGRHEERRGPASRGELSEIDPEAWAYLTSEPRRPTRQEIYRTLLKKLSSARETMALTSPYLMPDRKIWHALTKATRRGVAVRLIIPAVSDHPSVDFFSQRFARALAKHGVEVFGYEPSMIHAKVAVIDDWAMVSSFNLDMLSIGLNVENGLASRSARFRRALLDQYECDVATSTRF
ncbi:phosphatidylserine/phosphatidylglycerophosphate/cardiolipin synthase family protein [Aurantimonas sp. VKM B-3413]|uniref:phospholipase D-like domain-containing protein n=1 Tax=Aurantimonas sp. VKM B-3413 TaxID=2779401 RepID=UPI001E33B3F1|nr:phosphatidylserine/phosphatidylglycerophosphate/cardiolipin synthase family protein [Aurantimonas sp. VKM B-3413]